MLLNFEIRLVDPTLFFTPRRLDLAVKHRLFTHWLTGEYPDAEQDYFDHIKFRAGAVQPKESYLPKARTLFADIRAVGRNTEPVPVNREWHPLDGAHRISIAKVLGHRVLTAFVDTDHTWPAWGEEWFREYMPERLPVILDHFAQLSPGHVTNA